MRRPFLLALLLSLTSPAHAGKKKSAEPDIQDVAAQLLGRALTTDMAWTRLVELCDDIGHRLSGSESLEQAVRWGQSRMTQDGLDTHLEEVMVPAWVRGHERAVLLQPVERELEILTLGRSVGTPEGGITAQVVVVDDWDHLARLGDTVAGKIVLYDVPFTNYGETVQYRARGAIEASKLGAVASLVRSVTPESLQSPHTGAMRPYEEGVTPIPAAAITLEAASLMRRLQERGKTFELHLDLGAHTLEDALSHNVVGEIRGRTHPEEVVVLGCHLDSWDVGQGAQDDGAGCVAVMEAGRLIRALPVAPRRTIRVVLFTNEENGLRGGTAYADAHGGDDRPEERVVVAMEMDTGSGQPLGWRVDVRREDAQQQQALVAHAIEALTPVSKLLEPIGASGLEPSFSGADIGPLVEAGSLGLGVKQDTSGYWPIHHTRSDTVEKVDPVLLNKNVAALTVTGWWLAEHPDLPLPTSSD